jgi:hypothetical protein
MTCFLYGVDVVAEVPGHVIAPLERAGRVVERGEEELDRREHEEDGQVEQARDQQQPPPAAAAGGLAVDRGLGGLAHGLFTPDPRE